MRLPRRRSDEIEASAALAALCCLLLSCGGKASSPSSCTGQACPEENGDLGAEGPGMADDGRSSGARESTEPDLAFGPDSYEGLPEPPETTEPEPARVPVPDAWEPCTPAAQWRRELTLHGLLVTARSEDGTLYAITRHDIVGEHESSRGHRDVVWRSEGNWLVPQPSRLVPRAGALEVAAVGQGFALHAVLSGERSVSLRVLDESEDAGSEEEEALQPLREVDRSELQGLTVLPMAYGLGGAYRSRSAGNSWDELSQLDILVTHPFPPFAAEDIRGFFRVNPRDESAPFVEGRLARARQRSANEFSLEYVGPGERTYTLSLTTSVGPPEVYPQRGLELTGAEELEMLSASTTPLALNGFHFECLVSSPSAYRLPAPTSPPSHGSCSPPLPLYVELESPELEAGERFGQLDASFTATVASVTEVELSSAAGASGELSEFVRLASEAALRGPTLWRVTLVSEAGESVLEIGSPGPPLALSAGEEVSVSYSVQQAPSGRSEYVLSLRDAEGELRFWGGRHAPGSDVAEAAPEVTWTPGAEGCAARDVCFTSTSQYAMDIDIEGLPITVPHGQVLGSESFFVANGQNVEPTGDLRCTDAAALPAVLSVWRIPGR